MQWSAKKLAKMLHDPAVIIEIGTSAGEETEGFAKYFPNAKIYAYECNPEGLALTKERIKNFSNVVLKGSAVSSKEGVVSFFPSNNGNHGASSLFRESKDNPTGPYFQSQISVTAVTLEKEMERHNINSIDLLWMDAQGAELDILRGLGKRIDDVKLIHTEAEFVPIYEGQPLFWELKSWLAEKGFSLYGFTRFGKVACDAIFYRGKERKWIYPFYNFFWKYAQFIGRKIFYIHR